MSSSTITNTASGVNTNTPDSASKRYSLVKWLENSQFDAQNEWLGRLTSMPHSSIIDFDADELKAGMEISVIRNNGEIWRAQVIIPKIASNTIDLPPSSSKKIRTKGMGSGCKAVNLVDHHDTSSSSMDQSALIDLNDLSSTDITVTTNGNSVSLNTSNQNLIILTANNTTPITTSASSPSINSKKAQNNHNKEWQFLQTAINEANLSDFYHSPEQQQQSTNNSTSTVIKLNNLTTPVSTATNIVTVSDMNIETILQMQCDLLEQQKELKSIELETMEQLRLLQQNIGKLTRKFDSFETTCATYFPAPELKNAKKVLNTFSSSIKIVESELMKDYQPVITTLNNPSQPLIPSSSATSSSSSPTTTTTVTLTNHSDMNNDTKSNTTIVNLLPSSTAQNDTKSNDDTIEHIESNNKPTTRAQGIQTQMALNRFLRESVKQKLGSEFLISHAVSDIPTTIMRQIKKEAFDKYLPNDQRPIKAWGLAMASLRCLKRDLVKNKNKQLAAAAAMIAPAEQEFKTVIDMDCDAEKIIDSDEVTCKTTRRSGINLTVASSLSYVPTRSTVSGITRRQLSLNNVSK